MKSEFEDKHLKISSKLYEKICVPVRILLALLFLFGVITPKYYTLMAVILLIFTCGLIYKQHISPNTWKPYTKSIVLYTICALLMLYKRDVPSYVIGSLLLSDVELGFTTKFVVNKI